jgi:DNA-binding transcriptional LysR family regulator
VFAQLRDIVGGWSIDSGFRATRFENLINRDFDFLITSDLSRVPADVEVTHILTEPFVVVAPATYGPRTPSLRALGKDLDFIRFGRDPNLQSRIDEALQDAGVVPQHRYHLDTTEAVLTMIAAGGGWSILSPLAVVRSIARGDQVKAWPIFKNSFSRTINIASLKGAGRDIEQRLRRASLDALKRTFLPAVRAAMPECVKLIRIPG